MWQQHTSNISGTALMSLSCHRQELLLLGTLPPYQEERDDSDKESDDASGEERREPRLTLIDDDHGLDAASAFAARHARRVLTSLQKLTLREVPLVSRSNA